MRFPSSMQWRHSLRQILASRKAIAQAALRASGAASQILSGLLVARMIPAQEAGLFFIGYTVATIGSVVSRAGFEATITRFVAIDVTLGHRRSALQLCQSLLLRYLLRSICVSGALLMAMGANRFMPGQWRLAIDPALIPFVACIPFLGIGALSGAALQAAGRSFWSVAVVFYMANFSVMACALLPAAWHSAVLFNSAFLLGSALAAVSGYLGLRRALRSGPMAPIDSDRGRSWISIRGVVRDNAVAVVGNLALMWGPLALVGLLSTSTEASRYGVASRTAQLVAFALPSLNFVMAPRFAALRAQNRHAELRLALTRSVLLALCASSLLALPMLVSSRSIMGSFGADYTAGTGVFVLLVFAQWITGAAGPVVQFLSMIGQQAKLRSIFAGSGLWVMVCGAFLVSAYGALGAAAASLSAFLIMNTLSFRAAMSEARMPPESLQREAAPGLQADPEHPENKPCGHS